MGRPILMDCVFEINAAMHFSKASLQKRRSMKGFITFAFLKVVFEESDQSDWSSKENPACLHKRGFVFAVNREQSTVNLILVVHTTHARMTAGRSSCLRLGLVGNYGFGIQEHTGN